VLDSATGVRTVLMTKMNEASGRQNFVCASLGTGGLVGELVVVASEIF